MLTSTPVMSVKTKVKTESIEGTNTTVVSLQGHFDISMADTVNEKMDNVLKTNPMKVVFDLEGLTFISSVGLRILLYLAKKMASNGGIVALCSVNDNIQKVLEISGITKVLPIYKDRSAVPTNITY